MKLKLFWQQLSVSSPRVAVRSHRPWWLRLIGVGLAVGVFVATFWVGYRWGVSDAGPRQTDLERDVQAQTDRLARVTEERDAFAKTAASAGSEASMAQAARDRLATQVRALESENARMKEDLAFYERLLPTTNAGIQIRSFRVESDPSPEGNRWRYRLLIGQGAKPVHDFVGTVQLLVSYRDAGRVQTLELPNAASESRGFALSFRLFQRVEGVFSIPTGATVQSVQARILEGESVRAQQTISPG